MSAQKKRGRPRKIKFEDKIEEIQNNIEKRKGKWFLKAVNWIDWDDVSQIILVHIYKKWDQWDQKRNLAPWLNRIISNQIKNVLRNHYTNFIRPCVQCPFNASGAISQVDKENLCSWTSNGKQCRLCPLFKKWDSSKKYCQGINMPSNVDDVFNSQDKGSRDFDIDKAKDNLNIHLKKRLTDKQYKIYNMLYIKGIKPEIVAEEMGYKSNETGRRAGYKQIKNFETLFNKLARKIIEEEDIT